MVKHKYDCDIKTRKEQLELEQNAMVNRGYLMHTISFKSINSKSFLGKTHLEKLVFTKIILYIL